MEPVLSPSAITSSPALAYDFRGDPPPQSGGPLALLRFVRRNGVVNWKYARLVARLAYWKLQLTRPTRARRLTFICPGVEVGDRPGRRAGPA